jgi:poly(hydroxyalkanoate) granule-associated protein
MAARKKTGRKAPKRAQKSSNPIELAQQIWLAGLGALVRAQTEGTKLFSGLVKEGNVVQRRRQHATQRALSERWEQLRDTVETRTEGMRDQASETWDNLEKMFQARVHKALQQLGVPSKQEISTLSRKVNQLTHSVQELTRTRGASKAAAARKPAKPPANEQRVPH